MTNYLNRNFVLCLLFNVSTLSYSQTKATNSSDKSRSSPPTREEYIARHEKMIGLHTKMLECLKSNKAVEECHKEMMQTCSEMNDGACPMMQDGKWMHGTEGMMNRKN